MTATSHVPVETTGPVAPGADQSAPAATPAADTSIPEGFPAKFVKDGKPDYAALAQSYTALEGKLGATTPSSAAPTPEAAAAATQELTNGLQAAGLDINTFYAEYNANGGLSDESYRKLEAAGRPRAEVDAYIAGQEALFEQQAQSIYSAVGGEQQFVVVQAWAKANLPANELKAYNHIIDTGTPDQVRLAVLGVNAQYAAKNGREPTLVGGGPAAPQGFASKAEVVAAMQDPRYKKDEAYRASVIAKMRNGSPFGRR